jgi:glycosyltransferase involved in cell wall biosynthesis
VSDFAGLRIALVGPQAPPAGGMALQTAQLAELLRADGAQVEFVATNPPYRPAWVGRWRGLRAVCRLLPYLAALWRACGRADLMHLMANSGWSWHLCAAPAIWVGWLRRVPVVVNYRGGEAPAFLARSAAVVRASMARAAALVVPSGFLVEVFAAHRMPAQTVPNIVDRARFRPAAPADPDAAAGDDERILVARNLEPIYDIATALRAYARLRRERPQARLVVAGSGPEGDALRALAAGLGVADGVEFTGRIGRDEMAARLRASRVALNPSRVDNMPNSVLEALASGVPVVSTRVGGVGHIVEDGRSALLVPAGDDVAMAQALQRVLEDPALARRLREAGLAAAAAYTWGQIGPRWQAVYHAVLAPRRGAAQGADRHA